MCNFQDSIAALLTRRKLKISQHILQSSTSVHFTLGISKLFHTREPFYFRNLKIVSNNQYKANIKPLVKLF